MTSLAPIIPTIRREPFDDPAWPFDLKLDGFRGIADTVAGRMLSKNGNRLKRFEALLDTLTPGYVFDGEIVALDDDGRPVFNDLMFGRRAGLCRVRCAVRRRRGRARSAAEGTPCDPRLDRAAAKASRRSRRCAISISKASCQAAARSVLAARGVVENPQPKLFAEKWPRRIIRAAVVRLTTRAAVSLL
jgi:hypothetical protein